MVESTTAIISVISMIITSLSSIAARISIITITTTAIISVISMIITSLSTIMAVNQFRTAFGFLVVTQGNAITLLLVILLLPSYHTCPPIISPTLRLTPNQRCVEGCP